jgi:RNA ligase (TIGR02306 family)
MIPKTDQERIQNLTDWFDRYKDIVWEETLKLDGSSCTMYKIERELTWFEKIKSFLGFKVNPVHFGVCSRNLEIKRNDSYEKTFDNDGKISTYKQSDFWTVARKYNVEQKLPVGFALQGELIGPRIQANHEKVEDLMYFVFDIWDIKEQRYLTPYERKDFIEVLGILHVPLVDYVKIFEVCKNVHELLERVKGESMNPGTISEGRVYKSIDGTKSFKCINNEYLLKCEA